MRTRHRRIGPLKTVLETGPHPESGDVWQFTFYFVLGKWGTFLAGVMHDNNKEIRS